MRPALSLAVTLALALPAAAEEPPPWTLQDAIHIAWTRSPFMDVARAQLDSIEAQRSEAEWAWFPTFKLRSLFTVIPPQGGEPRHDPENPEVLLEPDLRGFNVWSKTELEVYAPLYTFGKIDAAKAMARQGAAAAGQGIRVAKAEIAYQVARAWYGVMLARQLGELIADAQKELKKARERLQRLEDEDSAEFDQDDKFRLRMYEADVAKVVHDNDRLGALARTGLRVAMGLGADEPLKVSADAELEPVITSVAPLAQVVDLAVRERPDLQVLRHKMEVTAADVDRRFAEFFPDFFFAGSFTYAASTVDFETTVFSTVTFNAVGGGALVGVQLTLDYPQKTARWHRAKADLRQARADLEGAKAKLRLELEEVWREVSDLTELVPIQEAAVKAARSLFVSRVQVYDDGLDPSVTMKDVLDTAVQWMQRRSEWLRSVYQLNTQAARLSRIVGSDITKLEPAPPP